MTSARVLGTTATTLNRMYALPFVTQHRRVLSSIAVNLTGAGAAGSNARLGLYRNADDDNLYPGALRADFGEVDFSSSGVKTIGSLTQVLEANHCHWFVYHAEDVRTVRALNYASGTGINTRTGYGPSLPTTGGIGWYAGSAYASGLPATFPAVTEMNVDPPLIGLVFSS